MDQLVNKLNLILKANCSVSLGEGNRLTISAVFSILEANHSIIDAESKIGYILYKTNNLLLASENSYDLSSAGYRCTWVISFNNPDKVESLLNELVNETLTIELERFVLNKTDNNEV